MNANSIETLLQKYELLRRHIAEGKVERSGVVVEYTHDDAEFEDWAANISEIFWKSEKRDRDLIIDSIRDQDVLWLLNGYPLTIGKDGKDVSESSITRGLAALCIVDDRVEFREMDHSLRVLFQTASRHKISDSGLLVRASELTRSEQMRQWFLKWSAFRSSYAG